MQNCLAQGNTATNKRYYAAGESACCWNHRLALLRLLASPGGMDTLGCGLGVSDHATAQCMGDGGNCGLGVRDPATSECTGEGGSCGLGVNGLATGESTGEGGRGDEASDDGVSDRATGEYPGEGSGSGPTAAACAPTEPQNSSPNPKTRHRPPRLVSEPQNSSTICEIRHQTQELGISPKLVSQRTKLVTKPEKSSSHPKPCQRTPSLVITLPNSSPNPQNPSLNVETRHRTPHTPHRTPNLVTKPQKILARLPVPFVSSTLQCEINGGALARRPRARHLFFGPFPTCACFTSPHQTIWSTFSPCLRIWPILCIQFMTMARVVVGSGGSDILCC